MDSANSFNASSSKDLRGCSLLGSTIVILTRVSCPFSFSEEPFAFLLFFTSLETGINASSPFPNPLAAISLFTFPIHNLHCQLSVTVRPNGFRIIHCNGHPMAGRLCKSDISGYDRLTYIFT